MSFTDILMITDNPAVSGVIWFVILTIVFYIARIHVHRAIISLSRVLHNAMRISAHSVMLAEKKLIQRNTEVLLAQGREASERIVEREFERVDATVRRDLAEYPALHRHLSEEITKIDEDYNESIEVPPTPPGWVKAVEAVAKIPSTKGDPMVGNVLEDIHQSLKKANIKATEEYRKSSHKRHQLLNSMMPHWRKVRQLLTQVDKNINSLLQRSITIDRHMDEYEGIVRKSDRSVRMLSSSSMTQLFISAFVLAIAVGGAIINFQLIARPLSEMVGGSSMLMGFQINKVAAMVIILVELAMGLFLMESLRITRLFPVIGALNDKVRIRMVWTFFSILLFLACVEAGLAFMREILMEEDAATRALLRGGEVTSEISAGGQYLWITTAAQMGMGFVLPFALMFVAIPLETFVHSLRTVLGIVSVGFLRALAWVLRLLGTISRFAAVAIVNIYDLVIFGPLWIERMVKGRQTKIDEDETEPVQYRGAA
jgi:hypothetical protein